jgi:hypothetical protein
MSGTRMGWSVGLAFVIGSAALACSAPAPQKTPLVVCTAGEDGCPSERPAKTPAKTKTPDDGNSGPSGTPTPAPEGEDETGTPPDAGTPDAAPATGPSCTKLEACCGELLKAGITGSAKQCDQVVDDKNEYSCYLANEEYKKADDYYDPVCF